MAQGKTKKITVTAAAPVAITAKSMTRQITISEDRTVGGYPTTAFDVMKPASTDDHEQVPLQGSYTFTKGLGVSPNSLFMPGETAGFVQLPVVASTTLVQDEQ